MAALLACVPAIAQRPVDQTLRPGGGTRPAGGYSLASSFDLGYRFAEVGGQRDLYRASVNYGDGLRLFRGNLRVAAADGKGRGLDEFSLRSTGGAGDPYQSHAVRVEKNGLYRYDLRYRLTRYYNRLPSLWRGEHGLFTERAAQAHDFTLRPGSSFEILLGYDRNSRRGPGFSSAGAADGFGMLDERNFLRFRTNLRQANRQYRAGFTARFAGLALTATRAVDLYKEGGEQDDASGLPSSASNVQPLAALSRAEPYHGRTPVTAVALRTQRDRAVGFRSQFVYSGGSRDSVLHERVEALDPAASGAALRESLVIGAAQRRQSSGDATAVLAPGGRWTITNTSGFHNTRIDGDAAIAEIGPYREEFLRFSRLGIRRISNATEATVQVARQLSVYGALRLSSRRLRSARSLQYPDFGFSDEPEAADNSVRSGVGGLRWLPGRNVRASFDFESGRADRPLAPTSERRFHNQSARIRWRGAQWTLSGYARNRVNDNPTELVAYSTKSRDGGIYATWLHPRSGTVVNAGCSRLEMETSAGILNLFDSGRGPSRLRSAYSSDIRSLSVAVLARLRKRASIHAGYSLTQDVGRDGFAARAAEAFALEGGLLVSSLPMAYHSPQARLSVKISDSLAWNAGWQFYSYVESVAGRRGFRSHIGLTSLTIGF